MGTRLVQAREEELLADKALIASHVGAPVEALHGDLSVETEVFQDPDEPDAFRVFITAFPSRARWGAVRGVACRTFLVDRETLEPRRHHE